MLHNKYGLLFLIAISITASCKKNFLDVDDNSNLYRQSYVKDLNTMDQFLKGIYIMLSRDFEHGNATAYPEIIADNIKPPSTTSTVLIPHYTWTQQIDEIDKQVIVGVDPKAAAMNPYWKTGYLIARACSFVIEDVDKYRGENPSMADNIKGQAYAIRGLVYFKLINVFAQPYTFTSDGKHPGIPYIGTSDISAPFIRNTTSEVYSNIIEDFTKAIALLPNTPSDTRYINSSATKALLARTYLFKEDFLNAKQLAVEITNQYPLLTVAKGYPIDIFKLKSLSQTESLFQLTPQSSTYTTNFIGRYFRATPIRFVSTSDIAIQLKENPNDVRQTWVTNVSGQWNITKFPAGVAPEVTPAVTPVEIAYYPPVVRSSEMFLTVAEASAKLHDENTARSYLDSLRKRANASVSPLTATGTALLDSIYKERRKELAYEGLRMWDLQRWKLGVHRNDALFSFAKDLPYSSNKSIAPIPPFDTNLAGISQNPGY